MKIVFFFFFFFFLFFCFFFIYAEIVYWHSSSKITLPLKCMISDVIWHKSIFSLVMSSPGGSCMSVQVKIILERNAACHNHVDIFCAKSKIALTGVCS